MSEGHTEAAGEDGAYRFCVQGEQYRAPYSQRRVCTFGLRQLYNEARFFQMYSFPRVSSLTLQ